MCGIVGYVGPRHSQAILLAGLARLEYRGYDSAGIAVIDARRRPRHAQARGQARSVLRDDLGANPLPDGTTGIGHTRWATHGGPTDVNAHPHLADDDKLAVIHNGIIENFSEIKDELLADGYTFRSETDTEVAAVLLGREYAADGGDLEAAFRAIVSRLEGAFTLLAMHEDHPGLVVGARRNSPLVIGLGEGENFLGSDVAAFVEHTRNALAIGQDQIVSITPGGVTVTDFFGDAGRGRAVRDPLGCLGRREGRMVELHGQGGLRRARSRREHDPAVARATARSSSPSSTVSTSCSSASTRIIIIACGTAAYAGLVGKYAIEQWARVPVDVELAHEFRYRDPVIGARHARRLDQPVGRDHGHAHGRQVRARARRAHPVDLQHAGCDDPARVGRDRLHARRPRGRGRLDQGVRRPDHRAVPARRCTSAACGAPSGATEAAQHVLELESIPDKIRRVILEREQDRIEQLAHWMADTRSVLFLGRHVGYPIALEGALKLKELAYIHAEGFAAGELKHGPIALIEPGQPVFVIVPSPRESARAAHEGRLEHPGDPRPRRPRHRDRRRGRRGGAAASPTRSCASRSPGPSSSPCSRSCRCTSSRWVSRPRRDWTSTSPATSRSPSRSSSAGSPGPRPSGAHNSCSSGSGAAVRIDCRGVPGMGR